MDIEVYFEEGAKVNARMGKHIIKTDQKVHGGGEDSAPAPFDYFLASLATCAGIYVKVFCDKRGIDSSRIRIIQKHLNAPLPSLKQKAPDVPNEVCDIIERMMEKDIDKRFQNYREIIDILDDFILNRQTPSE